MRDGDDGTDKQRFNVIDNQKYFNPYYLGALDEIIQKSCHFPEPKDIPTLQTKGNEKGSNDITKFLRNLSKVSYRVSFKAKYY